VSDSRKAKHYRCRFCGAILNAWLPEAKAPNGAFLLGHPSQQHLDHLGLEQMRPGDIGTVAAQAFEVSEEHRSEDNERRDI
jgi:hypothetical protein